MNVKHACLFALICFILQNPVLGDIVASNKLNQTEVFDDAEAIFGKTIGNNVLKGILVLANPRDACHPIENRPFLNTSGNKTTNAIALIVRGNCEFATKVLNAQKAYFNAAIVYDPLSDDLVQMSSPGSISKKVSIPSVFVGATTAFELTAKYLYPDPSLPIIEIYANAYYPFSLAYVIPFCAVIALCFFVLFAFMCFRFLQSRRRQRRNRLSKQRLKQLPVKNYEKGDEYDVCAICLDEYEEGEKLRILPCRHAYHCKCVDPWLTTSKRVCPLCKQKVLSDDETSDNDSDLDDDTESEEAPLLQNAAAASPNAPRYATGFNTENPFLRNYSSGTESTAASPLSVSCPLPSDMPSSSSGRPVTLAQRAAERTAPRFSRCVYVNEEMSPEVSPSQNEMASSTHTCESTDAAYRSCQSDEESEFNSFDSIQIITSENNSPVDCLSHSPSIV